MENVRDAPLLSEFTKVNAVKTRVYGYKIETQNTILNEVVETKDCLWKKEQ